MASISRKNGGVASHMKRFLCGIGLLAVGAVLPSSMAGAATPPTSIVRVPVKVAQTSDGDVGYRMLGQGSPLLLITGFGASMDNWTPAFVNTLASKHRV